MVALPLKAKRDEIGIDTLERAIVYSASLLKACYTAQNQASKVDQTITIGHSKDSQNQASIFIEAKLGFDNIDALKDGGLILNNLQIKEDVELLETQYFCIKSSIEKHPVMNNLPVEIKSLEHYFYYHCAFLRAFLPNDNKSIEIEFLENTNTGGRVQIKTRLPFDYSRWLSGSNYVCTVSSFADSYVHSSGFIDIFEQPNNSEVPAF